MKQRIYTLELTEQELKLLRGLMLIALASDEREIADIGSIPERDAERVVSGVQDKLSTARYSLKESPHD